MSVSEGRLSRASVVSDGGGSGTASGTASTNPSSAASTSTTPIPQTSSNNIKVIARFRPENALELSDPNAASIVQFLSDSTCKIEIKDFNGTFTFDRVFNMNTIQQDVFDYSLKQTVDDVFKGYNGTVLAYGQTGSGKSYTMMGPSIDDPVSRGAIPRIVDQIFDMIKNSSSDIEYIVRVSYMEIYMEKIKDLLNPVNDNLPIHEDKTRGVYVKGLTEEYVSCANDVYQVMRQGSRIRSVASTNMNQESSRSHSIFVIVVSQKNVVNGSQKTGQLFLVDLAGSEKVGKTGASGQTLEEAKKINKSLSALGMVINSLTDSKSSHIPYRDSKLTRILQESLGGNSRTSLIVNCSPSSFNDQETLSTLRFGVRAKSIKNKAKINAELSPGELRQLLRQCQATLASRVKYEQKLESELLLWRTGVPPQKNDWTELVPYTATANNSNSTPSSPRSTSALSTYKATPLRRTNTSASRQGHRSSMSNVSLINEINQLLPSSPSPSEADYEFLDRENALQEQLSEKETVIEQQEILIRKLKQQTRDDDPKPNEKNDNNDNEMDARQLLLEIDNLKYNKKELEIKVNALEDDNKELSGRLDSAMKEIVEISVKEVVVSEPNSPVRKAVSSDLKRQKMAELLGDMYVASDEYKVDEILQLTDSLPEGTRLRIKEIVQELKIENPTATIPDSSSSSSLSSASTSSTSSSISNSLYINDMIKQENDRFNQLLSEYPSPSTDQVLKSKVDSQSETIEKLMTKIDTLTKEKAYLQSSIDDLNEIIRQQKPNFEKTAALQAHISQFETMKTSLMRDLQDRCERIVELEISLDQARDQYDLALRNSNNKQQQKKMALLQRNLEQLTSVQRQLMEQNTQLKKEVVIDEKLLTARNERIEALEESLRKSEQIASEDREAFAKNLSLLKNHLAEVRPREESSYPHSTNIIKPLRGGGGSSTSSTNTPTKEGIWTRLNHYVNS